MRGGRLRRGIAAAAFSLLAAVPAARAETLADALIGAYRHSGLLEQNRALLRAADEDVAQAVAALLPVLDYVATSRFVLSAPRAPSPLDPAGGREGELTLGLALTADLLIWDSGAARYAIDAAKEAVLAAREALRRVEQEVLFRALSAYMNVRRAIAFVDLGQSNIRLLTQELRAAQDRFEVGEVTRTDVSIAEARLAAARAALASSVGDLAQAREEYRAAVGEYPDDLAPPPPPPALPDTLDAALTLARQMHPAIKEAQRQVAVAEFNILRAEAAMKPALSANARLDFDEEFDDTRTLGLSFGGPIYRGGRLSSLFRQAQARRDAARSGLHTVVHQIEQTVGNTWSVLGVTAATIQANQRQVEAARLAFRGFQEEATLGARTTLDVLDAEQELNDARAALIAAEIDRYVAVYALLQAMGMLTVDHLNLGIATYDAAAYYEAVNEGTVREVSPQGERLDRIIERLFSR